MTMPRRLRPRMTACRNCLASSTAPLATAPMLPPSAGGAPARTKVRAGCQSNGRPVSNQSVSTQHVRWQASTRQLSLLHCAAYTSHMGFQNPRLQHQLLYGMLTIAIILLLQTEATQ